MQMSNPLGMRAVVGCGNRWDFDEVQQAFRSAGLPFVANELSFAQLMGMLEYATRKYPDVDPYVAYMSLVSNPGEQVAYDKDGNPTNPSSCCGGATIV